MKAPFRSTPSPRLLACLVLTLIAFACLASIPASATQGAAFTTFDATIGGCLDSKNGIDCNNYSAKQDVYMNGGPTSGGISDGTYFFAVVAPGFQNGGFLDGANGNLSDTTASNGGTGSGDLVGNRTFTVTNHVISYSGTHLTGTDPQGSFIVALFPYDDTPNPGGVYILAVCPVGATDPKSCKYDAFRINASGGGCTNNQCGGPATLTVCKFWDQNMNHILDEEPLLGNWSFTATNVDGNNGVANQSTSNLVVDGVPSPDLGCTTFTITVPDGVASVDVTLTEGNSPGNGSVYCDHTGCPLTTPTSGKWNQSAPLDTSNNVETSEIVTVFPGDVDVANPFGNYFAQDLTVTKTAVPSFTRTYAWTATKTLVSPTGNPVEQSGGSATITYNVTATETGFVNSLWSVSGSISVTNPNLFDVSGVNVTEAGITDSANVLDGSASCNVTNGTNQTIAAGKTVNFAYTCTYSAAPSTNQPETNTATVTWPSTFGTPDTSANGTSSGFSFTNPTTTFDAMVSVYDCFNGCSGGATLLGTLTATNGSPFTSATYTVTEKVTISGGTCQTFTNVATVVDVSTGITLYTTNPVVSVTICNEATGALTMGFWQNKNGQGIITKSCGGTGTTSLYTFLTGYNPFKDLGSSTCSGEASYVLTVIKAASCTSTTKTCNSMLKAQMLSTALDVYFSDPTLGGDQVKTYNGGNTTSLGPVAINLSDVCSMTDGSSGSTCTGKYEDARPEFGIVAPCIGETVSDMLSYSNFSSPTNGSPVSNSGGTTWYKQIKNPNQVYAKDGFDNINNQIANIAASNVCGPTNPGP